MVAHVSTAPIGAAGGRLVGSGKAAKLLGSKVLSGVAAFFLKLRLATDAAASYEYLSNLSDHELRNRGLERSDIGYAVYEKYFGETS